MSVGVSWGTVTRTEDTVQTNRNDIPYIELCEIRAGSTDPPGHVIPTNFSTTGKQCGGLRLVDVGVGSVSCVIIGLSVR